MAITGVATSSHNHQSLEEVGFYQLEQRGCHRQLRVAAGAAGPPEMQMEAQLLRAAGLLRCRWSRSTSELQQEPLRCQAVVWSTAKMEPKVFSLQYSGERNMTHTLNWSMEPRPAVMLDTWSALRVVVAVGEAIIGCVFVSQHLAWL